MNRPDARSSNLFERCLRLFTQIAPGEGRFILIFSIYGFLIVCSFYIFKTIREPLLLSNNSAITKSYATALAALILFLLMPVYSLVFRRLRRRRLMSLLATVFALIGVSFAPLYQTGWNIGFPYYVWTAIYGVAMIAHFWAFANSALNIKTGQRLFPVFLASASLGGITGAEITSILLDYTGFGSLLALASLLLLATVPLPGYALDCIPDHSRSTEPATPGAHRSPLIGGIAVVLASRYLLAIAAYTVILNIVNSTGEYILAESMLSHVRTITDDSTTRELLIGQYYARYTFWITVSGFAIQLFVVSRLFARFGPCTAGMILPLLALCGYTLAGVFPIFSLIYLFKIAENSVDYSIMNATRQALFLPTGFAEKFEGKSTIDTLFWRAGDLLQVLIVHLGVSVLGWGISEFAFFNALLGGLWVWLAHSVAQGYRERVQLQRDLAPAINRRIAPVSYEPGKIFSLNLPRDAFVGHDPADVFRYDARQSNGLPLPQWLDFAPDKLCLSGKPPAQAGESIQIELIATDHIGLSSSQIFDLEPVAQQFPLAHLSRS